MRIANLVLSVILTLLHFAGIAVASAAAVVKCPDFYRDLYYESDILGKF